MAQKSNIALNIRKEEYSPASVAFDSELSCDLEARSLTWPQESMSAVGEGGDFPCTEEPDQTQLAMKNSTAKSIKLANSVLILERCNFTRSCMQSEEKLSISERKCLVSILIGAENGPELLNELLPSNYESYNCQSMTCEEIQGYDRNGRCSGCLFRGAINAPVELGRVYPDDGIKQDAFPLQALPKVFSEYTREAAESLCCPEDYIGLSILASAGAIIGNSVTVKIKDDWLEGANLFVAVVGEPGSKKSPGLTAGTRFLREIEQSLWNDYETNKVQHKSKRLQYEVDLSVWKTEAKEKKFAGETTEKPPIEPEECVVNRLSISDATCEAVATLLQENPSGLILIKDELAGLLKGLNQYRGGKGSDLEFYLSLWNRASLIVDRKGKEAVVVNKPFLSILGCLPPDILPEFYRGGVSDGFIDRFLIAWPKAKKQQWSKAVISNSAINCVENCFRRLYDIRKSTEQIMLTLTPEAEQVYIEWFNQHHSEMEKADFPNSLKGCWSKMPAQIARIALIIHCCRQISESAGENVDFKSMQSALEFAKYFKLHAIKAYGQVNPKGSGSMVDKLIAWLTKKQLSSVAPRDLIEARLAGCKSAPAARNMLDLLEESGYGLWTQDHKRFLFLPYKVEQFH